MSVCAASASTRTTRRTGWTMRARQLPTPRSSSRMTPSASESPKVMNSTGMRTSLPRLAVESY